MTIWDALVYVQGMTFSERVEAKTEEGAAAKLVQAAREQGVAADDVQVQLVMPHVDEESVRAETLVEQQLDEGKAEMVARVRKGAELLTKLANSVMEAEYAGADVRLLLNAVEEAQSLLTNAADATERGEVEGG